MFERPARRQFFSFVIGCAAALSGAVVPATARQGIVANDPIVLPAANTAADREQEGSLGTAAAPVEAGPKADNTAAKPLIEVPPAGTTLGASASVSGFHALAGAPPQAVKSASESKPLGRPNGALSARPTDGGVEAKAGLASKLDPRSNEVIRLTLAILAVAAALLIFKVILKRFSAAGLGARGMGARPSGVVEILARFPVGRGQQLLLIKLGRRIVLAHQAGSSMTTISEVTEPEEVASLLGRMEAGSSGRDAAKFQATLNDFVQEHDTAGRRRPAPRTLSSMETELVDLTRRPSRGLGSLLGKRVAS